MWKPSNVNMHYIKIILFSFVFFILIFAATYLSMQMFADQPSSSCLDCSYLKDTFFFSVFSLFVIPFVLLTMNKVKINRTLFSIIISALFILIAFINSFNLFKDRVSSWSSYSTKDEVIATIFQSYLYTFSGSIIVFLIFYTVYKTDKEL